MTTSPNPIRFLQSENKRLQQENKSLREEVYALRNVLEALRSLQEVSDDLDESSNVLGLLDRILQTALTTIKVNDGSLLLLDEESNKLVFIVVHGSARDDLLAHRIKATEGIAGWVAQNAEPLIVPDVRLDPRFSGGVDKIFKFATHSMVSVPIIKDEKVVGVIQALNKGMISGEAFVEADLTLLQIVAQLAANAIAKAENLIPDPPENPPTPDDDVLFLLGEL